MAKEEIFNAKVESMAMYGALLKQIIKEDGLEKALKMHAAVGVPEGDQMGKALKESLAGKKLNIPDLSKFIAKGNENVGMHAEFVETPKSLIIKFDKCLMYEGLQKAGVDHGTIQKMCASMSSAEYNELNKHFPELKGKVKFRDSPKSSCVEEFTIK